MDTPVGHTVSIQTAAPRGIAAVHARMPGTKVAASFAGYLDQVYAAARNGAMRLDGQNIFVYRGGASGSEVEVEFGVGVMGPFPLAGPVRYVEVPSGEVAATTHWGSYARLGEAHAAVIGWCRGHGRELAGPRWEVYGHSGPDPASQRTDIYYLLAASGGSS